MLKSLKTYGCLFFFIVACCSLAGCGFHQHGAVPLAAPLKTMYLQTDNPYGELARNLKQHLKMSGVHLVATPQAATSILNILNEVKSQNLVSINSSQQTRQYNLILTLIFEITDAKGRILIPPQAVSETRSLTLQSNQVLAGGNQASMLYYQMQRDIVYDVMTRLSSKEATKVLLSS